jgi:hypothetical protein
MLLLSTWSGNCSWWSSWWRGLFSLGFLSVHALLGSNVCNMFDPLVSILIKQFS